MYRLSLLTVFFTVALAQLAFGRSSWGAETANDNWATPIIVVVGVLAFGVFTFATHIAKRRV